jgi:hypothetical protein
MNSKVPELEVPPKSWSGDRWAIVRVLRPFVAFEVIL